MRFFDDENILKLIEIHQWEININYDLNDSLKWYEFFSVKLYSKKINLKAENILDILQ